MENEETPAVQAAPKTEEPAFLAQYRRSYPGSKKFYVTGDGMVFLEREYKQAQSHQKRAGKGELKIY